jgi:hypothetical protein
MAEKETTDSYEVKRYYVPIGISILGIVLYSVSFVYTSYINKDEWSSIQKYIPGVAGSGLVATILMSIALFFFYYNSSQIGAYAPIFMSSIALSVAYVALLASCMSRS